MPSSDTKTEQQQLEDWTRRVLALLTPPSRSILNSDAENSTITLRGGRGPLFQALTQLADSHLAEQIKHPMEQQLRHNSNPEQHRRNEWESKEEEKQSHIRLSLFNTQLDNYIPKPNIFDISALKVNLRAVYEAEKSQLGLPDLADDLVHRETARRIRTEQIEHAIRALEKYEHGRDMLDIDLAWGRPKGTSGFRYFHPGVTQDDAWEDFMRIVNPGM